ncbi:MAG: hypothetical protein R3D33_08195 [Hyphomicrobiaceae bacterium]
MDALGEIEVEDRREVTAGSADHARAMRRRFYGDDGAISLAEAETLFELNRSIETPDQDWADFFVEALTDYVVNQALPQGYVTADNADWLIDRISADGVVQTATELELLVKVIETARWVPARLTKFALDQVRIAVVEGSGPLRAGSALDPGIVSADEVELLRRVLYGFGSEGNLAISRAEAEMLFDINDRTVESRNDPEWSDLFVKAIACHIMAASGYQVPPREEALRREEWLEDRGDLAFPDVLGKMISGGLKAIWGAANEADWEEIALDRLEQQRIAMITAEEVTEPEAEWLAERIGRDGVIHENERVLIRFLKTESPAVHPALDQLIEKVA